MTITRKRAMSVVLGTSAAALSAASVCPVANATPDAMKPVSAKARPRHEHSRPPHSPSLRELERPVPSSDGEYVYKAVIDGEVSAEKPNTFCSGSVIRLTGVTLEAQGHNAFAFWFKNSNSWNGTFTLTTSPATTITVSWLPLAERREAAEEAAAHNGFVLNPRLWGQENTAPASGICSATTPNAAIASIGQGVVTWQLPRPAKSVAALLTHPPANIYPNECMLAFEALPDGTVPAFAPLNS